VRIFGDPIWVAANQPEKRPESEPVVQLLPGPPFIGAECFSASDLVAALQPDRWLEEYGDELFDLAMARVRDPAFEDFLVTSRKKLI